jgi:NAD(P)H dehydrogenase (quinone)
VAVFSVLARSVRSSQVVAFVRDPRKAVDLADRGVQVREADYSRPETLIPALLVVQRLLLISTNELARVVTEHANVIASAQLARVPARTR